MSPSTPSTLADSTFTNVGALIGIVSILLILVVFFFCFLYAGLVRCPAGLSCSWCRRLCARLRFSRELRPNSRGKATGIELRSLRRSLRSFRGSFDGGRIRDLPSVSEKAQLASILSAPYPQYNVAPPSSIGSRSEHRKSGAYTPNEIVRQLNRRLSSQNNSVGIQWTNQIPPDCIYDEMGRQSYSTYPTSFPLPLCLNSVGGIASVSASYPQGQVDNYPADAIVPPEAGYEQLTSYLSAMGHQSRPPVSCVPPPWPQVDNLGVTSSLRVQMGSCVDANTVHRNMSPDLWSIQGGGVDLLDLECVSSDDGRAFHKLLAGCGRVSVAGTSRSRPMSRTGDEDVPSASDSTPPLSVRQLLTAPTSPSSSQHYTQRLDHPLSESSMSSDEGGFRTPGGRHYIR